MKDDNQGKTGGAFPSPKLNNGVGFTKREYAAIMLRIPDSGLDWLDDMIKRSHKFKE